ncbi:hypothetical protein F5Y17DRAFT_137446 [Xylariaceae sp. FL0594]|nr:hypothetical protein F5Y17DRAFT_137446 [Xylariaceae sp. FL0594]
MPPTTSQKRKLPFGGLQRRVRARREEPEPEEVEGYSDDDDDESQIGASNSVDGDSDEDMSHLSLQSESEDDAEGDSEDEEEEENEDDEEEDATDLMAQVSFGALAKAQASMPNLKKQKKKKEKQKKKGDTSRDDESSDEEEAGKSKKKDKTWKEEHEESKSSSKTAKPPKRSSKHAPTEMSSKRMVSRKRDVIAVPTVASRDPRFSSASTTNNPTDEARLRKAYSFLDEYRDSEISALKAAIKKCKDAREKEELARQLKSMESKKEAQARKDAQRELIERHRRREKELVSQGVKSRPFYLKKAEQKKQLLLDRFAGMKKRDVQKTIERRRKKLAGKEKKNMPFARRAAAE